MRKSLDNHFFMMITVVLAVIGISLMVTSSFDIDLQLSSTGQGIFMNDLDRGSSEIQDGKIVKYNSQLQVDFENSDDDETESSENNADEPTGEEESDENDEESSDESSSEEGLDGIVFKAQPKWIESSPVALESSKFFIGD